MSQETRDAWALLGRRFKDGPLTLLGAPGPNRVLLDRARRAGALEGALDDRAAPTSRVVIPFTGAFPAGLARWLAAGHEVLDLTLPAVRRVRTTLGLLHAEGKRLVLAGHRGDPECEAIAAGIPGVAVVENADEAAALAFAPASGLVCQTLISAHRFQAIAQALQGRHRDGRLEVIDTQSQAQKLREKALAGLAGWADLILIASDPEDPSGRALYECARRHGCPERVIAGAGGADDAGSRGLPPRRHHRRGVHPTGSDRGSWHSPA